MRVLQFFVLAVLSVIFAVWIGATFSGGILAGIRYLAAALALAYFSLPLFAALKRGFDSGRPAD